LTDQISVGEG